MCTRATIWMAVLTGLAAGCAPTHTKPKTPPPIRSDAVDAIELFASPPSALKWSGNPGLDGVQVITRFYQLAQPQPVIVEGTVEFLMFEGTMKPEELNNSKPIQTWEYPPAQLPQYVFRTYGMIGYGFRLGWTRTPKASAVTVVCRYRRPSGETVLSQPIVIPVKE